MRRRRDVVAMRKIILQSPGILGIGPYRPGQVYEVEDAEAARLVMCKGFEYVNAPRAAAIEAPAVPPKPKPKRGRP